MDQDLARRGPELFAIQAYFSFAQAKLRFAPRQVKALRTGPSLQVRSVR